MTLSADAAPLADQQRAAEQVRPNRHAIRTRTREAVSANNGSWIGSGSGRTTLVFGRLGICLKTCSRGLVE
jgi:hypothetical protein